MKNYLACFNLDDEMKKVNIEMHLSDNEYVRLKKVLIEIEKDILENGYDKIRIVQISFNKLNPDNYSKAKSLVESVKDELYHNGFNRNDTLHSIKQIKKVIRVCLRHECYIQSIENIMDRIISNNKNILSNESKIS